MSFRINTNIAAINALSYLNQTNTDLNTSVSRLSSGLRVTKVSDDPVAYLQASQITTNLAGIDVVSSNTQNGISMSKVADGAMSNINDLLQELRGVVTGAANNGATDTAQSQADQQQVQSILQAIDRISSTTMFGTRNLLNGASGTTINITSQNASAMTIGSTFNGQVVRNGPVSMTQVTAATAATTTLGTAFANLNAPVNAGSFTINGATIAVAPGDTVSSVLGKINSQASTTHVVASFTAGAGIKLTSTVTGSNFGVQYTESVPILNNGSSVTAPAGTNAVYTATVPTGTSPATTTETFTGGVGSADDGLTLTAADGSKLVITAMGNTAGGTSTIGSVNVGDMRFQIGTGATDFATFGFPSMMSAALGSTAVAGLNLSNIDVTTPVGQQNALKVVDSAIGQVAQTQGDLGSFQNQVLQSNQRMLQVSKENYSAAKSTLVDADMAAEMTNLTKVQIMQQSEISVLSQANKLPQNILDLLK